MVAKVDSVPHYVHFVKQSGSIFLKFFIEFTQLISNFLFGEFLVAGKLVLVFPEGFLPAQTERGPKGQHEIDEAFGLNFLGVVFGGGFDPVIAEVLLE